MLVATNIFATLIVLCALVVLGFEMAVRIGTKGDQAVIQSRIADWGGVVAGVVLVQGWAIAIAFILLANKLAEEGAVSYGFNGFVVMFLGLGAFLRWAPWSGPRPRKLQALYILTAALGVLNAMCFVSIA